MRAFKNTWFSKFADKEGITDDELKEAVNRLEAGQAEANLGGNVYKVRVARSGEGKSGGYRVIVFYRSEERTFFVYGFAKSDRGNIDEKEKSHCGACRCEPSLGQLLKLEARDFKELAKKYMGLTDEVIERSVKTGKFIEI